MNAGKAFPNIDAVNTRIATALAVLPATALALTGCSAIGDAVSEEISEQVSEEIIEQAGGEGVDVDINDGEVSVETSSGSFTVGGGEIPDDYPSEFAPLVDGDPASVVRNETEDGVSFIISIAVDDDFDTAVEEATGLLERAGLVSAFETKADGYAQYGYNETDELSVVGMVIIADDETVSVSYTVVAKP